MARRIRGPSLFNRLRARTRRPSEAGDPAAKADAIRALIDTPTEEFLAQRHAIDTSVLTVHEINDALEARPDLPRPLLPIERDTLRALLEHADFLGRDQLLMQIDSAMVVGYCPCPCATIALDVSRDAPQAVGTWRPIPNDADVVNEEGELIGGVIVFTENGYLKALEIYDWLDDPGISPLPPLHRLQLSTKETSWGPNRWPVFPD